MCVFDTTLSSYGQCADILSRSDGQLILPQYKENMYDVDSGIYSKLSPIFISYDFSVPR